MRAHSSHQPRWQGWLLIGLVLGLLLAGGLACGFGYPQHSSSSITPSATSTGFCQAALSTQHTAPQKTLTTVVAADRGEAFSLTLCHLDPATGLLVGHDDLTMNGHLVGDANGLLYINQQNTMTGTFTALCALQMLNGQQRWCQPQVLEVLQTSSLLSSQGIVYVGTKQGLTDTLFALSEKDGSIRWKYSWETRSDAPVRFGLDQGRLYLGLENTSDTVLTALAAFQATTGQPVWSKVLLTQPIAGSIVLESDPLLVAEDGQLYVRSSVTASVYALDEATGALRWTVALGNQPPGESDFPQLLVANGTVYADAPDAHHTLDALNAGDGAQLWSLPLSQTVAAMAISGQTLYVGLSSGDVLALQASSGSSLWRQQVFTSAGPYHPFTGETFLVSGPTLYLSVAHDQVDTILAFNLQNEKPIWQGGGCTFTLATPTPSCYWDNSRNYNYPFPALIALGAA